MKTSMQRRTAEALWSSQRFDERVEFDAEELQRQPDFGPQRRHRPAANDAEEAGYAQRFYGQRAESLQSHRPPDEGLGDVAAKPRLDNPNQGGLAASVRRASRPLWRRPFQP